jgi:Flp pilus assembly protein TadD
MSTTAFLDAQELLHLGMHAVGNNDPRQAVECLKRCLQLEPDHPQATYMLGAVYAQIGMYDRAKDNMARAIELNPAEHTARFQLGLLHLTSGRLAEAETVWLHLDALPSDHYLNLFRSGLLALAQDDFARCVQSLEQGIAANTSNEPLSADMRKVLESVRGVTATTASTAPNPAYHFLERYRQQGPR